MRRPPLALIGLVLTLVACATTPDADRQSGYLASYDGLSPATADTRSVDRARPVSAADLAGIRCLTLDPPAFRTGDSLTAVQTAALADTLTLNLQTRLMPVRPVAAPGTAGCARIRTVVTEVQKSNVAANFILGVVFLPVIPSNGSIALEGEVVGTDGRQLGALVWARTGSAMSILTGLKEIGQAQALTADYADRFAVLLSGR